MSERWAGWRIGTRGLLLLLPLLLIACQRSAQTSPTSDVEDIEAGETPGSAATATPLALPTLLPTSTAVIVPAANVTSTPAPTPSPQSTVDFEQPVVELRYRVPSLQLDRRLEGAVSGQVTVVDETRGVAAIRQNQGGVLLELQGVLSTLDLEPLPDDCQTCVAFSYELPLESTQGEGWLQDPVLLASVENYTAALLGPHFPPDSVLGLRRSATAYDVAHSLALDNNGILYRWLATTGDLEEPMPIDVVAPDLPDLVAAIEMEALEREYVVNCVSAPLETLYVQPAGGDTESDEAQSDEENTIRLACPAFSLPRSLLPLYARLDGLLQETLEGSGIPRPPSEVALKTLLDFRREDGTQLEIMYDGTVHLADDAGETVTTTLSMTDVMSLTDSLLESGLLQPDLAAFTEGELPNLLLVRGDQGMMALAWPEGDAPQEIADEIEILDGLLENGD